MRSARQVLSRTISEKLFRKCISQLSVQIFTARDLKSLTKVTANTKMLLCRFGIQLAKRDINRLAERSTEERRRACSCSILQTDNHSKTCLPGRVNSLRNQCLKILKMFQYLCWVIKWTWSMSGQSIKIRLRNT